MKRFAVLFLTALFLSATVLAQSGKTDGCDRRRVTGIPDRPEHLRAFCRAPRRLVYGGIWVGPDSDIPTWTHPDRRG